MKLTLVGCEYTGKTTLAEGISKWTDRHHGKGRGFHDHFAMPNHELNEDAKRHLMSAPPQLKEMFQRFMIAHHLSRDFFIGPDQNFIGFHIEEAVYAPLYYGYGGEESGAAFRSGEGQRTEMARAAEHELMRLAPDAVLVLLRANPDVIRRRMREGPHEDQVIAEKDVEHLLDRFEEEFEASVMPNKLAFDTSESTPQTTLDEFLELYDPHWTDADKSSTWAEDRQQQIDRTWASYL